MSRTNPHFAISTLLITAIVVTASHLATKPSFADQAPVIPLPPDIAKALESFGAGFMGKALPAPPVVNVRDYLNLGEGTWEYKILSGGKDGKKVRSETYERMPDQDGFEIWKRTLGTEYVEYIKIAENNDFGKHLEDDLDLGYTSRFLPGVVWLSNTGAGKSRTIQSKIEAFKTKNPDHVSYHGEMASTLTYVGQYEVTVPAGTFPALLAVQDFEIKIGPANVSDKMYVFFAKGVGKIAEIEATRISAILIYHSSTKITKVLTKYPKR